MSLPRKLKRLNAFAAGVLIGLCAITPAFAASLTESLPPRDWLLVALLVLLAVMLAVRLLRRRTDLDTALESGPDDADLRWWRNP